MKLNQWTKLPNVSDLDIVYVMPIVQGYIVKAGKKFDGGVAIMFIPDKDHVNWPLVK